MKTLRFFLAGLMATSLLAMSTIGASAQGVGGNQGGGSTGGGTGSGGSGLGSGGSCNCGGTLGWQACGNSSTVMVMWNLLQFGKSSTGAQLAPYVWNPTTNPTGNVYVYPNTPWGLGAMPPNNKDQNGNKYFPWWACLPTGNITVAKPPVFHGFNTFAAATISNGTIALTKPTSCAPACHRFLVFDQVEAQLASCIPAGAALTPMVAPPALPYPTTNTGVAFYSGVVGCPQSVTVVGTDVSGTYSYKYTLQWQQVTIPGTNCASYLWNWGVPADGVTSSDCGTNVGDHNYEHVFPNGPVTSGSGAQISAKAEWRPQCTGMVQDIPAGTIVLNDPVPGSYACTSPGDMPQAYVDPNHYPVYQIESVSN